MVCGDGTFGRGSGLDDVMRGRPSGAISVLKRDTMELAVLSLPYEDTGRVATYKLGKGPLQEADQLAS